MSKIRYFENAKMTALEKAMMEALTDLNSSIIESIAEGFTDNLGKPRALYDILMEAFQKMVERDLRND